MSPYLYRMKRAVLPSLGLLRKGGFILPVLWVLVFSAPIARTNDSENTFLQSNQNKVLSRSPYPRMITPNGDGVNDRVFFFFEATDAPQEGRIYDLNGGFVAGMKPGPVQDASLVWDGKDDKGRAAPMGVYIYKVTIGGRSTTGTVVVAR